MQQIENDKNNKKAPKFGNLLIWKSFLVRKIDLSWSTLESSLVLMYEKLIDLGWVCYEEEIHIIEIETEESKYHV